MKKNIIRNLIAGLAVCGSLLLGANTTVHADSITLPKGYTINRIYRASRGNKREIKRLANVSRNGMMMNNVNHKEKELVNLNHPTKAQSEELAKYTLSIINNAREQVGQPKWHYSRAAMNFARDVAKNYERRGSSILDPDHDVIAILQAAKKHGLNHRLGQIYEDESGLPYTTGSNSHIESVGKIKNGLYFNVKQMLFGGYYGNNINDMSKYFEYEHARDLLTANYPKSLQKKQFGMSFSTISNNPVVSVHMIGVSKPYIQNYKKYK